MDNDVFELYISSDYITDDHMIITELIKQMEIETTITPNYSVAHPNRESKIYTIQKGYHLIINTTGEKLIDNIWPTLHKMFKLDCGYIKWIRNSKILFSGCVLEFITHYLKTKT